MSHRMQGNVLAAAVIALSLLAGGCSDDPEDPINNPGGGTGGTGGTNGPDGGGGGDAFSPSDGPQNAEGPLVEILSPTEPAAGDYSADAIMVEPRFTVTCEAKSNPSGDALVDSASVRIFAIGRNETREALARPTGVPDVYEASINVEGFENGAFVLRCTASDLSQELRTNSDEFTTYLDLGPRITVFSPAESGSYANQLGMILSVSKNPVADDDDTDSAIVLDSLVLSMGGAVITELATRMGDANSATYQATIAFDADIFPAPLEGPQTLSARARNARGVERRISVPFIVDSDGPLIEIQSPAPGTLISQILVLTAEVTDISGIDPSSVVATIAGREEFSLQNTGGDTYVGLFDTRLLPPGIVYPTVVVRAQDLLANQSSYGFSLSLDNSAPVVMLNPPLVREGRINPQSGLLECSRLFDPVGEDAVNDPTDPAPDVPLAQLSEIRALVVDRGNVAATDPGNTVPIPLAGVNPASVQLFVLDNEQDALLVDRDGDGVCDDINPLLVPTSVPTASDEVAQLDLSPIPVKGAANYLEPGTLPNGCNLSTLASQPPSPLCVQTPLTRVLEAEDSASMIYTIGPVGDSPVQCVGTPFDSLGTNISEGWACVAARAEDHLGNLAVSPPVRVCIDFDGDGFGDCPSASMSDCSGTYNLATNTVDPAANCVVPDSDRIPPGFVFVQN